MPSQGISRIASIHAVVLAAERRWRSMRGMMRRVIATPAIIEKLEAIIESNIAITEPNLPQLTRGASCAGAFLLGEHDAFYRLKMVYDAISPVRGPRAQAFRRRLSGAGLAFIEFLAPHEDASASAFQPGG
ncbi:protein of unknown function [Methylocella tundrae]|uniref:Uncharacterized protein n=1 Tax=Methylocella tundrae TaxID=227605 RepID=A0A4U8Z2C1_METTU|nr:protein of unknown function [Methylocella tundrae]